MTTFKQFVSETKITTAKAKDLFLYGGCLAFAIALQKKIGGSIYVMKNRGKPLHAFLKTENGNFDYGGKRSTGQMALDCTGSTENWEVSGPHDPSEVPFKKTDSLISKAAQYIEQNPKPFGIQTDK